MKTVVSVSLGSRQRDHEATLTLLGETVAVRRQGTDGNLEAAVNLIQALDGQVDAIGLGGIDRYLVVRNRRYEIQDAARLAQAAVKTPVVDGSGIKDTFERALIESLHEDGVIAPGQTVLMVSSMDRFGMAETFERLGYQLVAGDLIFASHIHYPIRTADELEELARKLLPSWVRLPFHQLYPVGDAQVSDADPRFHEYFDAADIIAGDFHYIRRYMPETLAGKVVITNTTTPEDVALFAAKGVRLLVTTTPVLAGRSFGTNVIEAALVAVSGVQSGDPDWGAVVARAGLQGTRRQLNANPRGGAS
ncbi:MAG: quinate 5-dehydrogenase [Firmicutes bacterium]|nr:quinate 5-dehydrogenase [Bacillota bacterium]